MSRTVSFACASALLLAFAAPAVAQQQFSQDRVVTTAGVDVNTRGGADIVLDRIENTAESICGDRPGPMQLQERTDVANCTYETTEIAVNDSGIPMLHQRYYGYEPQIIIEDELGTKGSK